MSIQCTFCGEYDSHMAIHCPVYWRGVSAGDLVKMARGELKPLPEKPRTGAASDG